MAIFNITSGVNGQVTSVIDTGGTSQPVSAAQNPTPFPTSTSAVTSTGAAAADVKTSITVGGTTLAFLADRA